MPETIELTKQNRNSYLKQEHSVNIKEYFEKQKKIEQGSLEGIEMRNTVRQLGKDDFLKLLITQLSYQDPTAPVKDQQFIAQMAQFSSLEQMQNISGALNKLASRQTHSLIGRYVIGPDFANGEEVKGIAQAFFYDGSGKAFLKVGGRAIAVDQIQMVSDPSMIQQEFGGNSKQTLQTEQGTSPPEKARRIVDEASRAYRENEMKLESSKKEKGLIKKEDLMENQNSIQSTEKIEMKNQTETKEMKQEEKRL